MELSYSDRLKAIYDKEQALSNAIVEANFSKVSSILKDSPEILTDKHVRLNELLKDSSTPEALLKRLDIGEDLNYYSQLNAATYYTERNNLHLGNPTESLAAELNSKDPSHKEPIIYHLKNGADISLITKESIERKLDDISLKNYAGYKIAEMDQTEIIKFATIHAIKTNNVPALRSLEKEFEISRNVYLSDDYIKQNSNMVTTNYTRGTIINEFKENQEQPIVSELRLKQLNENRSLEIALSRGNIDGIKKAIVNGADESLVNLKSIKHLDNQDQMFVILAAKEAKEERAKKIPEAARFDLKEEQNKLLKDAVKSNEPLKAYNAIKNGADIKVLKTDDFSHLNKIQANSLKLELQRAVNENTNNTSHSQNLNNSQSKKVE